MLVAIKEQYLTQELCCRVARNWHASYDTWLIRRFIFVTAHQKDERQSKPTLSKINSRQDSVSSVSESSKQPLWTRFDDRFFWNKHLVKEFSSLASDDPNGHRWVVPVIMGFVEVKRIKADSVCPALGQTDQGRLGLPRARARRSPLIGQEEVFWFGFDRLRPSGLGLEAVEVPRGGGQREQLCRDWASVGVWESRDVDGDRARFDSDLLESARDQVQAAS